MLKLYHSGLLILCLALVLSGCTAPRLTQSLINVTLTADGVTRTIQVAPGSTAEAALQTAGILINTLDRSEPPLYTVLAEGASVRLVRVRETFEVEQVTIPFEHQTLRNELLPEGETRLSQPGVTGLQENTYRIVYEDDVEISRSIVKTTILQAAIPEIMMVGSQSPFAPLPIPGRLALLVSGNAWVMDQTTGNRRPVVPSSDLDGRVFALSPDGRWLLYTRKATVEGQINSLWVTRVDDDSGLTIDLKAQNVVHFAAWAPDSLTIAYSTVEPRSAAPGWQANNDLQLVAISPNGFASSSRQVLEVNTGGVYGWWGMNFAWAPTGGQLAYFRPDGVGLFDIKLGSLSPLFSLIPLQTGRDWAWVPGLAWGPDGKVLYTVDHVPQAGVAAPEESPFFDLTAIPLTGGAPLHLVSQVGMFAYPATSPLQLLPSGETAYQVAYLQAVFPAQSETSPYRLMVMDRDGSNRRTIFPAEGAPGMEPQQVVWAPAPLDSGETVLAVLYQDNLWLVSAAIGYAQQITGDGLTFRVDWK
jgi:hypothetical protein